jgi:ABC-type dipeptide/oligopeptide/nickel transport system permease subunit
VVVERIQHYAASDFVPAMLACGISDWRIVNLEILWRNCRAHLLNKAVSVFGMALFLQCSVDFVVSVGLTTEVNLTNVPTTLGSLLAKIDSKQDILALGIVFSDPSYFPNLFVRHLQGLSTAFIIVFTLLCFARIAEGIGERYRL